VGEKVKEESGGGEEKGKTLKEKTSKEWKQSKQWAAKFFSG